jgi:hypothetical protein
MDRLQHAKFRPKFVESAVRSALRDAVAWRIGGGAAPSADAFGAAAVAAARLALDTADGDLAERARALAAVGRAARRFTASALWRRLTELPAARFLRVPHCARGPEVVVRDRRRRLHAITLSVRADTLAASNVATCVAAATPLGAADRLAPVSVHVFSLVTGRRYTFQRDVGHRATTGTLVA